MKYPNKPILIVDDEKEFLFSAELILKSEGISNVVTCSDSRKVKDLLKEREFSLVLFDILMPHITGYELLEFVSENHPTIPVIILTALHDVELAVNSMKLGASDYMLKPVQDSVLVGTIKKALQQTEIQDENSRLKEMLLNGALKKPSNFKSILTEDVKLIALFKYIEAISSTPLPVLIQGETGVGKELFAQSIHLSSGRKGDLVAVNVAGVDDNLFSDTLFGHVKGAFTGADQPRKGLIEQAQDGTIFLDEIGDLSIESQVKLLRLIQENKYYPLGSDEPKTTNARIIVASHKDLHELQLKKVFRSDLYYRLQSHKINVPALRDRKDDLELLVNFLLEKSSKLLGISKPSFPPSLITLLKNYSFPGNIRELEGMIMDALSRHEKGVLSLETFKEKTNTQSVALENDEKSKNTIHFGDELPSLEQVEKELIQEALRRSDNNQTIAASLIGLSRRALNNRITRNVDK